MKLAVLERTFSPPLSAPMTFEYWMQINHTLDGCLEARQVHWIHSWVSMEGDRSTCLFEVPYADVVRVACREARMPFQRLWQAEFQLENDPRSLPQGSSLVIAELMSGSSLTKAEDTPFSDQREHHQYQWRLQPVFSVASLDKTYTIDLFLTSNVEEVRSFYQKKRVAYHHIWRAILIQS